MYDDEIFELRNQIEHDLKIRGLAFSDFNRNIVIESIDGEEVIVPVKELYYEAKPNKYNGATSRIIKEFTEKLGWEYIRTDKQAWVNGWILHHIYFKL